MRVTRPLIYLLSDQFHINLSLALQLWLIQFFILIFMYILHNENYYKNLQKKVTTN